LEIVVVGGGAAGLKAAARIRRLNDEAVITVIEAGKYPSVSKCGLPFYVGGLLQEPRNLLETTYGAVRDVNYFKKVKNIVTVVEIMDHVLPSLLDEDVARMVESHVREKGVNLLTSSKVERILNDGERVTGVVVNGKEIEAELVVVAAGVKPNVELAEKAGIELGETGAIKVNERMQTSDRNVYAGGDCVECRHVITGKAVYTPMGSVANKHGRVIADNICGIDSTFPGVLGTAIFRVFGMNVGRTGLCEKEVENAVTGYVAGADRFHFLPEHKPMQAFLTFQTSIWRTLHRSRLQ